jgi:hypothetical protein
VVKDEPPGVNGQGPSQARLLFGPQISTLLQDNASGEEGESIQSRWIPIIPAIALIFIIVTLLYRLF